MASSDIVILPQVTIQADAQEVVDEVRQGTTLVDNVWISCYRAGATSVHGKAEITLGNDLPSVISMVGRDGIQIRPLDRYNWTVTCNSLGIEETRLRAPKRIFGEIKPQQIPKKIEAFDVSPNDTLFATGSESGTISIVNTSQGLISAKTTKPHVAAITRLRFFPSNEVLLVASMDMSISVVSVLDQSVPRRLKGHSRAVTDIAIIERGRNVASCAKDGTVRLWDIGAGKQLRMMGVEGYSPVHRIAMGSSSTQVANGVHVNGHSVQDQDASGEVGTAGKVLCCALQSGRFTILDLESKSTAFTSATTGSPLSSIAYDSQKRLLATGSQDGIVSVYDERTLGPGMSEPLYRCKRNGACIEDMSFTASVNGMEADLVLATTDGLPFRLTFGPGGPEVAEELVGHDCDPIRVVRSVNDAIWTAGDDGIVRRY